MSYQKLGKIVVIYGICHLFDGFLTIVYYFLIGILMNAGNYSMEQLLYFGLSFLRGLLRSAGNGTFLVGFSNKDEKNDETVKKLRNIMIVIIITGFFNFLANFLLPFITNLNYMDIEIYILLRLVSHFLFFIPTLIFSMVFFQWGMKLKQEDQLNSLFGFVIILSMTIITCVSRLIPPLLYNRGVTIGNTYNYLLMTVNILYTIGFLVVANQLMQLKIVQSPEFASYQTISSYNSPGTQTQDRFCPACGIPQNNIASKFCKACGKPL